MPGAAGIGMVHVVPALAEGEQSQRPQVGGAVVAASSEGAGADHMAQRVDAPGDVLQQGDADQSGPQQGGQRGVPATADGPAQGERQPERQDAPGRERRRDLPQGRVGRQVGGIALDWSGVVAQQPAHVRVGQTAKLPGQAGSVPVRRMRVARPVGERMMTPVDRDPADDVALEAHRPRDGQRDPQRGRRGEAAVGEQAVEADGHPEPREQVERYREQDVGEIQGVAPGEPYRHRQPAERHEDDRRGHRDPDPAFEGARRRVAAGERLGAFVVDSEQVSHRDRSVSGRGRSCRERCNGQAGKMRVAAGVSAAGPAFR